MPLMHGDSIAQRWPTFSFAFQMANIGTDVARALESKGMPEKSRAALARALELLSLTITNTHGALRQELCRTREALAASYDGTESRLADLEYLTRYFDPFLLLASTERRRP